MPTLDAHQILREAPAFVQGLIDEATRRGIDVSAYPIDHVCCRTANKADYVLLRTQFLMFSQLLSEALIGGRPICTFRLPRPICVGPREISLLELPSPKSGQSYETGLEHCEFVVRQGFDRLAAGYPQISFDLRGMGKAINPELVLPLSANRAVKFHAQPLDEVIELENAGTL